MERTEEMNMDLGVIRDALTQELTISHYSVLKDTRIRDDFIQAVKVTGDLDRVGSTVIPLIIQANCAVPGGRLSGAEQNARERKQRFL